MTGRGEQRKGWQRSSTGDHGRPTGAVQELGLNFSSDRKALEHLKTGSPKSHKRKDPPGWCGKGL